MASDLDAYGTTTYEPRVQFGGLDNQHMPLEWASAGMRWLFIHKPQVFAEMMTEGILGIEKRAGRH